MQENFGVGPEQVETLFDYAKCIYECGDYEAAGELLHQYCTYSVDPQKLLSAMWGKLASEILAFSVRPSPTCPRTHRPPALMPLPCVCAHETPVQSSSVSWHLCGEVVLVIASLPRLTVEARLRMGHLLPTEPVRSTDPHSAYPCLPHVSWHPDFGDDAACALVFGSAPTPACDGCRHSPPPPPFLHCMQRRTPWPRWCQRDP